MFAYGVCCLLCAYASHKVKRQNILEREKDISIPLFGFWKLFMNQKCVLKSELCVFGENFFEGI